MKFHVPKGRIYNERKTTYYNKRCLLIYFNGNSSRELKKMSYTINDVKSDVFQFIKMVNYIGNKGNTCGHTL